MLPFWRVHGTGERDGAVLGKSLERSTMTDVSFDAHEQAIRQHVAAQGFLNLIGAQLGKITKGTCEMSVQKRPELLQQHGMFHGGVTAFLVDNSTTIAASTMIQQGQAVLTAEYKLSLLAPGVGERLVCRARVILKQAELSRSSPQTCSA